MVKRLVWFGVAVVAVYACGNATEIVGEGMRDAGTALMDAGDAMIDAGDAMVPDAGAQTGVLNLTCDTVIESDSGGFATTTYYARVEASELPGPFNVYTCPVEKPQFQNVRAECYSLADFGHTITDDGAHWFECGSCTSNCPRYEPHTLRIVR